MSVEFEFEESLSIPSKNFGTRDQPLQVSDLTQMIKAELESEFSEVVLVGEISNFKAHPSGHFYFVLKDANATISACMFRGANQHLRFEVQNGQKVLGVGRVSVYPPRGSYQIVLSRMEPEGLGSLQLAFEQLKAKLEKEGLFSRDHKKPLPKFPKRIGLVTSSSGAAVRDILNVLERRFSGLEILVYNVRVQGDTAAAEISNAIQDFNRCFPNLDVLIVGRGGGSLEDLWPFNEEIVARSIFESQIPIISAVGHEIDFTIADFVADVRAPTPSAAAELVVSDRLETLRHLEHLQNRLKQVLRRLELFQMRVDDLRQRLSRSLSDKVYDLGARLRQYQTELVRFQPTLHLQRQRHRLQTARECLIVRFKDAIRLKKDRWSRYQLQLELTNPKAILERGYSIVRLEKNKKLVKKAADVQMGDALLIEFHKGTIRAKV